MPYFYSCMLPTPQQKSGVEKIEPKPIFVIQVDYWHIFLVREFFINTDANIYIHLLSLCRQFLLELFYMW